MGDQNESVKRLDEMESSWEAANRRQRESITRLLERRNKALALLEEYEEASTSPTWNRRINELRKALGE